ncbi:hypothetical protein VFPFJ_02567 [Purpureocillium lilacinum]|uniref:Cyclin-D1-binding protein 1-like N-terminal domain-containing protein n=1 Tax=Purpureocillium lilacinum TaxID=33203 RepID=A0A179HSF8_PURLI|nr:hypothetical protein VFPFJ_02567 [Purpureocillium lilacinum]OAQ93405.1 hypothetical protein VFPFJ_02567 [Purpureocillium lilacinum]
MATTLEEDVASLNAIVASALSLFTKLKDVLEQICPPSPSPNMTSSKAARGPQHISPPAISALPLAKDCADLIKAHSSKVALFLTNDPYNPSAVVSVIRQLMESPVPGLVAAAQACTEEDYTLLFRRDLIFRAKQVLERLIDLMKWVPLDGRLADASNSPHLLIGKLWSACEALVAMATLGVAGHIAQLMRQWKETLRDIKAELKDWSEEVPDEDQGDNQDEHSDDANSDIDAQDLADQLMSGPAPIPCGDPNEIRPRLNVVIKRLGLMTLFYGAVIKRRITTAPELPPALRFTAIKTTDRLEEAASILALLPDRFEAVALTLYEPNTRKADEVMDLVTRETAAVRDLLKTDWEGKDDEFTAWSKKFEDEFMRCGREDAVQRDPEPQPAT